MRRETRYRLLGIKEGIIRFIPIVVIGATAGGLVWAILTWPKHHDAAELDSIAPETAPEHAAP